MKKTNYSMTIASVILIGLAFAAILLSGFTSAVRPLLYGVNVGGLGTLIASLASVISYRAYSEVPGAKTGKYMIVFTGYNLLFLLILCAAGWLLLSF